eukprot:TRINITY_DN4876_c0_g1_i1.p1 TRINITY_DN4876_c0_g1~~TRINITY_DN4876_c0_g1_i1.p1  ORF type:complete len:462 (+),score=118.84 TRINITY_DN4876_c0_g1_i1:195-1388(+)
MNNPQYLLDVKKDTEVSIKVFQAENVDERISFYVVRYNDDWKNRKKVVINNTDQEIVKIDGFWAALFSETAQTTVDLRKGQYVIIPCSENSTYTGKFSLNVWKGEEDVETLKNSITLTKLNDTEWKSKTLQGEWTKQTAGGGNILGLSWRKNPQYVISTENPTLVSVVLAQQEKDHSIGFYIIKYDGYGRKMVDYNNEVAKTDSFKFVPSVGVANLQLEAKCKYVVIPCTHQPTPDEKFTLTVYSDEEVEFYELTSAWEHIEAKRSGWKEETAGGSPNNETFVNNPQFLLSLPEGKRTELLVNLVVPDPYDAVGFLVVRVDEEVKGKLQREDINNDNIFLKPEGWEARMSVSAFSTLTEKTASSSHFVIIPSTFKPGVEKEFELTIYSDQPIKLVAL